MKVGMVLLAVGRTPKTGGTGLAFDGGAVNTDDRLRTSLPYVYAILGCGRQGHAVERYFDRLDLNVLLSILLQ